MRRLAIIFVIQILVSGTAGQTATGSGVTPEMRTAANEAFQRQDWKTAVVAYEKIVKLEDKNAGAKYRYGLSLLGDSRNAEAVAVLESAMAASPNPVFALALARGYARTRGQGKDEWGS